MNVRPDALATNLVLRVWLPYAFAYYFSYGLRNINVVLGPTLAREFSLGAAELGLITGAYFVAFTLAQLPLGLLLDRYGPRRVNATLVLFAAAGSFVSALASSAEWIVVGRALIGLGVSLCLMSAYKAHAQWLPASRVQFANSLLLTFGSLGVLSATGPVGWALDYVSWRAITAAIGVMLLASSALLFLVAPERREPAAGQSLVQLAAGLRQVFEARRFWGPSLSFATVAGTFSAFQSLWLGTWLRDVARLTPSNVIVTLTWIALAATIGYTVLGILFDRLLRAGVDATRIYRVQNGVSIVLFAMIVFSPPAVATPVWMIYCVFGAGGPMVFAILAQQFPIHLIGRVNTAANVLVFTFAFFAQWLIGVVLDRWPTLDGHYAADGYRTAIGLLFAVQLAAYVFFSATARELRRS